MTHLPLERLTNTKELLEYKNSIFFFELEVKEIKSDEINNINHHHSQTKNKFNLK